MGSGESDLFAYWTAQKISGKYQNEVLDIGTLQKSQNFTNN